MKISFILALLFSFLLTSAQSKKDSLYVFVGEKISLTYIPEKVVDTTIDGTDTIYEVPTMIERKYIAKYKVLKVVYGSYKMDTIEFTVYSHYRIPKFSEYKYVLLYISKEDNTLYQQRNLFSDVYKTTNGRWGGSYAISDYMHENNKHTIIKPQLIQFVNEVSYNVQGLSKEVIAQRFPSPYFKIRKNKAIAIWGNYIEELFALKKNGVLKARGIF